jgi:hypothetical protein
VTTNDVRFGRARRRSAEATRDGVSKGYKDVAHMKRDTDLDPLRQRQDFQKLIAELDGKGR